MDDKRISDLLDRKKQKAKQAAKGADKFYQLCVPGNEQMMTFRVNDSVEHLSLYYNHLHLCYYRKATAKGEMVKAEFAGGWNIYIYGRGLESVHRALVSRSLLWVRSSRKGETDDSAADVFIKEICPVGPNVKKSSGANATLPEKKPS